MNAALHEITEKLCRMSREYPIDPYAELDWPETLDRDQYFMSPELISLHGTSHFEGLSEVQRMRLSFYEAVNFFSINIHGERLLMEGLARRLYRKSTQEVSPYLHHFLDEENKHMFYFGRFCNQYAGKIYPEKRFGLEREYADGEEDFLFFARVLLFEELVDVYNRRMGKDDRLVPIAREINRLHHFEEARHLAFGRRLVEELFAAESGKWAESVMERIASELTAFLEATWNEFFNPEAYRDAGLPDPYELRRSVLSDPAVQARRHTTLGRCARTLLGVGLLTEDALT